MDPLRGQGSSIEIRRTRASSTASCPASFTEPVQVISHDLTTVTGRGVPAARTCGSPLGCTGGSAAAGPSASCGTGPRSAAGSVGLGTRLSATVLTGGTVRDPRGGTVLLMEGGRRASSPAPREPTAVEIPFFFGSKTIRTRLSFPPLPGDEPDARPPAWASSVVAGLRPWDTSRGTRVSGAAPAVGRGPTPAKTHPRPLAAVPAAGTRRPGSGGSTESSPF